eukprot:8640981-Alexandrium_andersonii.AAC.1
MRACAVACALELLSDQRMCALVECSAECQASNEGIHRTGAPVGVPEAAFTCLHMPQGVFRPLPACSGVTRCCRE